MATVPIREHVPMLSDHERYEAVFQDVEAPFAFVDLDALWKNADDLLRRAAGKPIRVATKSVRCRALIAQVLAWNLGFRGLMTFTLPETLWLAGHGLSDLLLAYPAVDRAALAGVTALEREPAPMLVVDSTEQLDLMDRAATGRARPFRVCIEIDVAFQLARGRVSIGPKRSPIRTAEQAVSLAREIDRRPGFELAGVIAYEGQIAGLGDRPRGRRLRAAAIKTMQRASMHQVRARRAEIVTALRRVGPVELVNGGGTGSLQSTAADPSVTEVTAGSGLYAPGLFDDYASFTLRPAAMYAVPVVRRPRPSMATVLGGGYLASGPADRDRLPRPHLPEGLALDRFEGAGEVQTPLRGRAAADLRPGDRVYLRHAKAGELCERFDRLYLVAGERIVDEVPTYRGEGRCFL